MRRPTGVGRAGAGAPAVFAPAGRVARIAAGIALFAWGYTLRESGAGMGLMAVSLVPLVAGSLDWCLISALLGGPIRGAALRKTTQERG